MIIFYRGFALHIRLNYPARVLVHPSWDTDRNYLLMRAGDVDEAKRWCDQAEKKAEAHIRKAEDRKAARVKEHVNAAND